MKRNELGLLEGVTYKMTEDGRVDWRKMFKPEHLYLNPNFKNKSQDIWGKPFEEVNPLEVEDKYLISTLQGTRYLLQLRGYVSVKTEINFANDGYACATVGIQFIPNLETDSSSESTYYSDAASAHLNNTSGFGKHYLVELAANRALVRCVRNYLNIGIVSREELGVDGKGQEINDEPPSVDLTKVLTTKLMNKGFKTFKDAKPYLLSIGITGLDQYETLAKVPKNIIYLISGAISEAEKNTK